MKILFVASWFPSRVHATDGNFVEKHARIVATKHDLLVLHAQYDPALPPGKIVLQKEPNQGFVSWIAYFGLPARAGLLRKSWIRHRAYYLLWQKMQEEWGRPDLIHGHILFSAGIMAAWWSKKYKIPFVLSEHASLYHNGTRLSWYHHYLAAWVARQAMYILPVSQHLAEAMQALGMQTQWRIIPNSVNTRLFHFTEAPPMRPFRFLHISNFVPRAKNTEGIIRAFAQLLLHNPDVKLTIAGDGDLAPLQALAKALKLSEPQLQFLPEQSEAEVAALMQSHHSFVLFSNYENLPVVLLEAQCCGLPVIATQVGGIPEIIESTKQGMIIPAADEEALLTALRQMIAQYERYDRVEIAAAAQARYAEASVLDSLEEVYFEVRGSRFGDRGSGG